MSSFTRGSVRNTYDKIGALIHPLDWTHFEIAMSVLGRKLPLRWSKRLQYFTIYAATEERSLVGIVLI